jgi:hypothetical protein
MPNHPSHHAADILEARQQLDQFCGWLARNAHLLKALQLDILPPLEQTVRRNRCAQPDQIAQRLGTQQMHTLVHKQAGVDPAVASPRAETHCACAAKGHWAAMMAAGLHQGIVLHALLTPAVFKATKLHNALLTLDVTVLVLHVCVHLRSPQLIQTVPDLKGAAEAAIAAALQRASDGLQMTQAQALAAALPAAAAAAAGVALPLQSFKLLHGRSSALCILQQLPYATLTSMHLQVSAAAGCLALCPLQALRMFTIVSPVGGSSCCAEFGY